MGSEVPHQRLRWTRREVVLEAIGLLGLLALVVVGVIAYRAVPALAHRYDFGARGALCGLFYVALASSAWSPPTRWRLIALTPANRARQLRLDRRLMLSAKLEIIWCLVLLEIGLVASSGLAVGTWGRELFRMTLATLPVALLVTVGVYGWHVYEER